MDQFVGFNFVLLDAATPNGFESAKGFTGSTAARRVVRALQQLNDVEAYPDQRDRVVAQGEAPPRATEAPPLSSLAYEMAQAGRSIDVAIRRWAAMTGEEAKLAETGETFEEVAARRDGEAVAGEPAEALSKLD